MTDTRLKILFAISEAYPFVKVGGLGDVGGALPGALAALGHDVRVLLPGYPWLRRGPPSLTYQVRVGGTSHSAGVWSLGSHAGAAVYTVGNPRYFATEHAYGYEDDDVRPFVFFSRAAAAYARSASWHPDVVHCHDWHLGLVPQVLAGRPTRGEVRPASAFTIHNAAYQGRPGAGQQDLLGRGPRADGSMLSRGVAWADGVNTVSGTYLQELLRPDSGMGLDELLRARSHHARGILNGVDYDEFSPATDPHLVTNYDLDDLAGKRENKAALQRRSGLRVNPDAVVVGMVARLVDQKGVDLVLASLPRITELGVQFVVMGVGDEGHQSALQAASRSSPDVAYHATDDEGLARLVYAGSDVFLAPSRYEPCGLGPLIALRYGAVPVVRRTGGLAETITDCRRDPADGVGFTFVRKYPEKLAQRIGEAVSVYHNTEAWALLQKRGMSRRFTWEVSAKAYDDLYRDAIEVRGNSARSPRQRRGHA